MTEKLDQLRNVILSEYPDLAASTFELAPVGWDSIAVDVDDRLIFKFPRHEVAQKALVREAALLAVVRPRVSMAVPDLRIFEKSGALFSLHEKLKGEHLLTAEYDKLPKDARQRLGDDLGQFYAELHRLDSERMADAGAAPVGAWQSPATVREKAVPALPSELRSVAEDIIAGFERLPPDPHGQTYGFFDGHGWNMAFDHARSRLNGIYDFADSGFGPVHQEFIYSNLISPDLTERIVAAYERTSGLTLDLRRIEILTGFHRLSELAELPEDCRHTPAMTYHAVAWLEDVSGSGFTAS
ncbi:aminoglycoside phosphotransferase family protein [Rhizobium sullae]|uniref:Aminoglycoside phosphotransferase family protein n=1 Tax=Rhizobium sullae TaxID=50338 RepID=A0ABY5XPV4_RHISU|nr:aminoglycoside phosphotransferase family protein [Rhizobium sullae]UWU16417.1 aminoglycoside phosphotransferase family protein [Rhizobium sullae]